MAADPATQQALSRLWKNICAIRKSPCRRVSTDVQTSPRSAFADASRDNKGGYASVTPRLRTSRCLGMPIRPRIATVNLFVAHPADGFGSVD